MKYLSLYKTSSEYSADNSRLVPNISLITGERKMFLTNENNIDTTFTEVDIIESFDDIINRFPTGNSTSMPGLKIYGDNTDQSNAKNIKLFNAAQQWRSNYLSHNGLSDTGQPISLNVDALMIDNIIMDKYDGNYKYHIEIYDNRIILYSPDTLEILTISSDGSININYIDHIFNIFPSSTSKNMLGLKIYTDNTDQSKAENIKLYNNAQEYRKDYILHADSNNISQRFNLNVNALIIDNITIDEYDGDYNYCIDIYNDHITLIDKIGSSEMLTIFSDGWVIGFNEFPSPTDTSTVMPGLKIYTDNTDQSKAENIKLYNNAQEWRNNSLLSSMLIDSLIIDDITIYKNSYNICYFYIYNDHIILLNNHDDSEVLTISNDGSVTKNPYNNIFLNIFPSSGETDMFGLMIYIMYNYYTKKYNVILYNNAQQWRNNYIIYNRLSDTGQPIRMPVDKLIIDDKTIDEYNYHYKYAIDIYNDRIILYDEYNYNTEVLTIYSDGSIQNFYNTFPSTISTNIPGLHIYMYDYDQANANNTELYNNAKQYRDNYISYNGWSDTGQSICVAIDSLLIDYSIGNNSGYKIRDKYDNNYKYYIDIYNDHIILLNRYDDSEVLTILGDGSFIGVNMQNLFNIFPILSRDHYKMPGLKIYGDNSDQSKLRNIELYNDAQECRKDDHPNWSTDYNWAHIYIDVDGLIIDDSIIDEYDGNYNYHISIYGDRIILGMKNGSSNHKVLTILSDGSVDYGDISSTTTTTLIPKVTTTTLIPKSPLPH